jgi:hypothetical protein
MPPTLCAKAGYNGNDLEVFKSYYRYIPDLIKGLISREHFRNISGISPGYPYFSYEKRWGFPRCWVGWAGEKAQKGTGKYGRKTGCQERNDW